MTGPEITGDPAEGADRRDRTARAGRADRGDRADRPRRPLWKRKRLWIPVGVVVLAVVGVGVSAALILPRVDTVQSELRAALPLSDQVCDFRRLVASDLDQSMAARAAVECQRHP
ncbi:hypothetical protein FGG90_14650 [Clavibacter tessellarius]|uniref:hypothetical protein n=1 Tax=Clavibacter tessellarius TaxID=31965 RepID=UPI001F37D954|nr:hypothetical protein [Clavibacter michiganensis]UKF35102.1 hypothetical protein FGG90_14650 [Clavibacter michiganensis subsp. tessellarius]